MQLVSCISRSVCLFVAAAVLFVCVACTLTWLWVLFSFNNHFPINTKRVFFTLINTELFINICNKNQSTAFAINQHQKQSAPARGSQPKHRETAGSTDLDTEYSYVLQIH